MNTCCLCACLSPSREDRLAADTSGEVFLFELFTFFGRSEWHRTLERDLFKQHLCGPLQWTGTWDTGFAARVSGLVLHSGTAVGLWGRVSMSVLAVFSFFVWYSVISPPCLPSFLCVPLKFAHQPSGPEEHLCPSSFPICPMPLSLPHNSRADHLFITNMN